MTSDRQAIGKRLTSDGDNIKTNDKKRFILDYIKEHQKTTVSDASAILELSKPRIRAILREMATDGTIEKIGNNRYAHYVPKKAGD